MAKLSKEQIDALLYEHAAERTPCEIWTRVMGYHRPISEFNPGKQAEHAERKHFQEAACNLSSC